MIRHASLHLATTVPPLAIAVVEPPFGALLVTAVGATSLSLARMPLTSVTTVSLTAITTGAQKELGATITVPANPSSEDIVRGRHAPWQAVLDNGSSFVAG